MENGHKISQPLNIMVFSGRIMIFATFHSPQIKLPRGALLVPFRFWARHTSDRFIAARGRSALLRGFCRCHHISNEAHFWHWEQACTLLYSVEKRVWHREGLDFTM